MSSHQRKLVEILWTQFSQILAKYPTVRHPLQTDGELSDMEVFAESHRRLIVGASGAKPPRGSTRMQEWGRDGRFFELSEQTLLALHDRGWLDLDSFAVSVEPCTGRARQTDMDFCQLAIAVDANAVPLAFQHTVTHDSSVGSRKGATGPLGPEDLLRETVNNVLTTIRLAGIQRPPSIRVLLHNDYPTIGDQSLTAISSELHVQITREESGSQGEDLLAMLRVARDSLGRFSRLLEPMNVWERDAFTELAMNVLRIERRIDLDSLQAITAEV